MMSVPSELSKYFTSIHFKNYPKVEVPQSFRDERGLIINIADGQLGDVAIIHSRAGAVRANHVHQTDWHLSYCLSGSLDYSYLPQDGAAVTMRLGAGEFFFTPSGVVHRMEAVPGTREFWLFGKRKT